MAYEQKIIRTYKFRIYPTKQQEERLNWVLSICQQLYNAALQECREAYRMWKQQNNGTEVTLLVGLVAVLREGVFNPEVSEENAKPPQINYYTLSRQLTELKEVFPELKQIFDKILRDVLMRIDKATQAFYRRVRNGEKPGYPRYKGLNRYDSFTYPAAAPEDLDGIHKGPGWVLHNNKLTLHMGKGTEPIGPIKIKLHRTVLGNVRSVTIVRKGNQWYACFAVAQKITLENPITTPEQVTKPVGVSLGLEKLATLSTGETIENPRHYQRSYNQLVKAQQTLSRKNECKKKGRVKETKDNCRNLKKARLRLRKIHEHIANQRLDFQHKLSRKLVDHFDGIVFGDWAIKEMTKRAKPQIDKEKSQERNQTIYAPNGQTVQSSFNKAILDAGWRTFISFTAYKAAEAGKYCKEIEPQETSQTCCNCDWKPPEPLDPTEREFLCGCCGLRLSRNLNTAFILLKKQFGANCAEIVALREQLSLQKISYGITLNATG